MSNLSKFNQRNFLSPFLREMFDDNLFSNKTWDTLPAANIAETEKEYSIELAVPGYQKADFKIKVEKDMLTISAETKLENEKKDKAYTRKEYNYSSFARSFTLPDNVKDDAITAKYDNGILTLTLPKSNVQITATKEIEVA